MLQEENKASFECALDSKGDEFQRLSVLQSLPSLLATDSQSCMSRVVPRMQQSLATASTEFHIAASSTFKTILEQKLVSHSVFSQTFLQSILSSLESRDPVVCHAWLETLLDVIELLPVEVIRTEILPLAISKGQLSQPTYSRIICSRLLGKICTRFDSALIQKEVLPTVHSLCQDVNNEVRASICLQLRFVAEGLGAESVKPALLPSLVELASDEESNVRCTSVQTIVYLLPHLQEDTIKSTIVPLIKKLCENAMKSDDEVICIIAQEFGKIVLGLEKCLLVTEKAWFLKYFQQLSQMGTFPIKKETKPHLPFMNSSPIEDEKYMECRRYCAFNLPAMFVFVSNSSDDTDTLLLTLTALANDNVYLVRRTVACGIHEVAKLLGPKSGRLKTDLIKLLKDDSEEVLQGLVPHLGVTLDCLAESQTIGVDRMDSTLMEIGRALLKCESEIASTHNWRLISLMHSQLEILPKYFPSDFIYTYFVPMALFRILHARPLPVRLAAGTLFLFLLRYNMKPMQRVELRSKIYSELANNPDCYVRMMFVRMMIEALEIFSSVYFKEHFFTVLLNLAEDPVANIRLKVVSLLPQLKSQLQIPTDKKLLAALETTIGHLLNSEKDKDVLAELTEVIQKLDQIELKYDGRSSSSKITKQDVEDARKLEEEKRLSGMASGKSPAGGGTMKKGAWRRPNTDVTGKTISQTGSKDIVSSPRQSGETSKTRSMPEIPVMLSDDEFLVDAGIRIPMQFPSPSVSKIPHLQDSLFAKRRGPFGFERSRSMGMNYDKGKPKRNSSVEYEDCMKRKTNGVEQSSNIRTSLDCEDGLRLVKKDQQLGKKDTMYVAPLMRSRYRYSMNQERSMDDKMKRNSLILDKDKPKMMQPKCSLDRTKRHSGSFEKGKPKRNSSIEYEDSMKRRTNGTEQSNNVRTSLDYGDDLGLVNDEQLGKKDTVYVEPMMRSRFGFGGSQQRWMDEKLKRNSLILDKDKQKMMQSKCTLDRTKRHSANFSLKPMDSKEMKPSAKCHSLEMPDYGPSERLGRALRRYSTLDVNHNQGLSKIPLRSFVPRSRTAPATRASSPVHIDKLCRMPFWES
ncbi:serine/threonine-protein phosphatase 4 regulatory subunit 4 isoform X5 [Calliopsis andreniformis]|uniref:serine/threonine-protein phosphatase 4 regulatory subunit 4 isoform X5 n=1 Tax=Calliopsis andreniformis TaxID=337506 RepID=UPI003FCCAE60